MSEAKISPPGENEASLFRSSRVANIFIKNLRYNLLAPSLPRISDSPLSHPLLHFFFFPYASKPILSIWRYHRSSIITQYRIELLLPMEINSDRTSDNTGYLSKYKREQNYEGATVRFMTVWSTVWSNGATSVFLRYSYGYTPAHKSSSWRILLVVYIEAERNDWPRQLFDESWHVRWCTRQRVGD